MKSNAANRRAQRRDPKRDTNPRKVVEIGVFVTAGQLRRLESLMGRWNVPISVLPEVEPAYRDLPEWYEYMTGETETLEQRGGIAAAAGGK